MVNTAGPPSDHRRTNGQPSVNGDDYLINPEDLFLLKESTQIFGATLLNVCLGPEMKGKVSSSESDSCGNKSKRKGKEKVDVAHGKGIELLSDVALMKRSVDRKKEWDDTTYQFDDDVDARLKEPTQTDKEVVQYAHVTISTVTKKTKVPVTSSSRSSDLASKFLNFLDIPHADAEIVSPLDVHVHHEVPRTQAPTLLTYGCCFMNSSPVLHKYIPQSSKTFTPPPILTTPTSSTTIENYKILYYTS
ncbi:hypothetical protein Tco_1115005 [Tanacetum coccineum]